MTQPSFKVFVEYEKIGTTFQFGQAVPTNVSGPIQVTAETPDKARALAISQVRGSAKDGIVWVRKIKRIKS